MAKAGPKPPKQSAGVVKADEQRKLSVNTANTVTKDFLLLSQQYIHQGMLIASASSGRRLYVHHLSEIPLSEVFLTRTGNHVQRVDKASLKLAGSISILVPPAPPASVPSVPLTAQIATSVFSGPISGRDHKVRQLLQRGIDANTAGDFGTACACFEAAYALSLRAGLLVSAANMRLKLSQPNTAAAMYRYVLTECSLLPAEHEMASRKLIEAQKLVQAGGGESHGAAGNVEEAIAIDSGDGGGWGAFSAEESPEQAESSWGAFDEEDFDADFGEPLEAKAPPKQTNINDGGAFASFDEMPAMQPPPSPSAGAPVTRGAAVTDADADDGDFADFGAPAHPAAGAVPSVSSSGTMGESSTSSERRVRQLERRLQMLEQTVSGGASRIDMLEHEQKLAQLTAQVDRRLSGVRKGMGLLHERLNAVETAMSKLPDHLGRFRDRIKAQATASAENAAAVSELLHMVPAMTAIATECHARVAELSRLSGLLSDETSIANGDSPPTDPLMGAYASVVTEGVEEPKAHFGEWGSASESPPVAGGEGLVGACEEARTQSAQAGAAAAAGAEGGVLGVAGGLLTGVGAGAATSCNVGDGGEEVASSGEQHTLIGMTLSGDGGGFAHGDASAFGAFDGEGVAVGGTVEGEEDEAVGEVASRAVEAVGEFAGDGAGAFAGDDAGAAFEAVHELSGETASGSAWESAGEGSGEVVAAAGEEGDSAGTHATAELHHFVGGVRSSCEADEFADFCDAPAADSAMGGTCAALVLPSPQVQPTNETVSRTLPAAASGIKAPGGRSGGCADAFGSFGSAAALRPAAVSEDSISADLAWGTFGETPSLDRFSRDSDAALVDTPPSGGDLAAHDCVTGSSAGVPTSAAIDREIPGAVTAAAGLCGAASVPSLFNGSTPSFDDLQFSSFQVLPTTPDQMAAFSETVTDDEFNALFGPAV
uniref:Uncharacterized protein n=1 Tax=Calcidiscus leptoporus TaxID=127549 RepID=A0A7S0J574_9EUKA|mmetsp:Transcript_4022/g.9096  ORF Transcript_4022/g.9096 Transcript_4022/m.9096 type:complete len:939 (+) Transcript_4022:60-2876(+)